MRITSYSRTDVTARSSSSLPICVVETFTNELFWRKKRKNDVSVPYPLPLIQSGCLSGDRSCNRRPPDFE